MESQPQNPEFRNNPENFHPCVLRNYHNKPHSFMSDPTATMYSHSMSCDLSNKILFNQTNNSNIFSVFSSTSIAPTVGTVKTLYSDILYNSKILYSVNCICTNVPL